MAREEKMMHDEEMSVAGVLGLVALVVFLMGGGIGLLVWLAFILVNFLIN